MVLISTITMVKKEFDKLNLPEEIRDKFYVNDMGYVNVGSILFVKSINENGTRRGNLYIDLFSKTFQPKLIYANGLHRLDDFLKLNSFINSRLKKYKVEKAFVTRVTNEACRILLR